MHLQFRPVYVKMFASHFSKEEVLPVLKDFLWVFLVSMVPVVELRGAIPIGCGLGLPWWQVYIAAVAGNMLPVPFIVLFIRRVFAFLRAHWSRLNGLLDRLERRAQSKMDVVRKFEVLGLCLFVAIPLPGTGAWTGAFIAALLDIRLRRAVPVILLGVLIAGAIVTAISYGVKVGVSAVM